MSLFLRDGCYAYKEGGHAVAHALAADVRIRQADLHRVRNFWQIKEHSIRTSLPFVSLLLPHRTHLPPTPNHSVYPNSSPKKIENRKAHCLCDSVVKGPLPNFTTRSPFQGTHITNNFCRVGVVKLTLSSINSSSQHLAESSLHINHSHTYVEPSKDSVNTRFLTSHTRSLPRVLHIR